MDRDGRWTLKRGRKPEVPPERQARQARQALAGIAVPPFGYKNHVGIDRRHGFVRRFRVTDAAAADGRQLGAVLDPENLASGVWADLELLERRGLKAEFQRRKTRGKPMPASVRRGTARRARFRSAVEHVLATRKHRLGLVIRTVGLARATAKLALASLAYDFTRLAWIEGRAAPA